MAIVLHHSAAKGTAKVIMLGIANHDGDGGAYPAVSTLAKYANVSDRSVQETLNALVEMGEITIVRNGGGQRDPRYRTNRYEVLVQCPDDCDKTKNHRSRGELHRAPEHSGVKDGAFRGEESRDPGVNFTAPEPSSEPPSEPPLFASDSGDANLNASFEDLWKAYPRKEDKKAARAVWSAMKPVDRRAAALALPAWVGSHDAKFAPYLCRWLRNRRWEDEITPKVTIAPGSVAVADRALCADLGTCVRRYRHKGMTVFVEKHGPFPDRLWALYDEMYPDPLYRVSVAPDGTVPS